MLKVHSVFNLTQIEGLESLLEIELGTAQRSEPEICEEAERVLQSSDAKLSFDGGPMAFYDIQDDSIHMPEKAMFNDQLGYYATMLHELTHWTGAESRLNRNFQTTKSKSHYAVEELVAELDSSFLCAHVGLKYTAQHASYISEWLKVLREDKGAIFKAAAQARVATEFLVHAQQH